MISKMNIRLISLFVVLSINSLHLTAQEIVNIYNGNILNSKNSDVKEVFTSGMYRGVTNPTLEVFLPEKEKAKASSKADRNNFLIMFSLRMSVKICFSCLL